MENSEIRQDKVTKQWVIYAPARRKRPRDFRRAAKKEMPLPSRDENCPFCPGNKGMLPPLLDEVAGEDGVVQVRVVPNKFPALTPEGDSSRFCEGIYLKMQGYGNHEVVIETPRHDLQLAAMSVTEVETVIEAYHRRYLALMAIDGNMMVIIFRNHGLQAGTSLVHPHSQIIATGMVPGHIRWREEAAERYFDEFGRCVYCDILACETEDARRVVHENDSFVVFVPFAAEVPFETWIMPKQHKADFGDITGNEKHDLASALRHILARLHTGLNDPDYNYIINTSARFRAREPQLHWYLQIRPRLMTMAGFEIGSGININPSVPEEDAAFLKEETGEESSR
jgi:UDPglucose--hexose-1-phosphate uridylyltransferase